MIPNTMVFKTVLARPLVSLPVMGLPSGKKPYSLTQEIPAIHSAQPGPKRYHNNQLSLCGYL